MSITIFDRVNDALDKSIDIDSFTKNLEELKDIVSSNEWNIVYDMIQLLDISHDKFDYADMIKVLVLIVESIRGVKMGNIRKKEAKRMFVLIIGMTKIKKADKRTYIQIFDNVVELIFWGMKWKEENEDSVKRVKSSLRRVFCCGSSETN